MSALLSTDQVAERLGVSERSVRRLVARGDLPAVRIGGSIRFQPDEVQALIDANVVRHEPDANGEAA